VSEWERETERQRDRDRDRQTDRQREREVLGGNHSSWCAVPQHPSSPGIMIASGRERVGAGGWGLRGETLREGGWGRRNTHFIDSLRGREGVPGVPAHAVPHAKAHARIHAITHARTQFNLDRKREVGRSTLHLVWGREAGREDLKHNSSREEVFPHHIMIPLGPPADKKNVACQALYTSESLVKYCIDSL
jgi:hypothetical protein